MKFALLIASTSALVCDHTATTVDANGVASCIDGAWVATDNECDPAVDAGCYVLADANGDCPQTGTSAAAGTTAADTTWCVAAAPADFATWCADAANSNDACPSDDTTNDDTTNTDTTDTTGDDTTTTDDAADDGSCTAAADCDEAAEEVCMTVTIADEEGFEGDADADTVAGASSECTTQTACDDKAAETAPAGFTVEVSCGATKLIASFAALALAAAM